jgi:hypothetical protein
MCLFLYETMKPIKINMSVHPCVKSSQFESSPYNRDNVLSRDEILLDQQREVIFVFLACCILST